MYMRQRTFEYLWRDLLSTEDQTRLDEARFARRSGAGERPAIVVIDAQNYMVGPSGAGTISYPSACGPVADRALHNIRRVLTVARATGVPILYTRFELRRDGADIGVYGRKRDLLETEGWCLEGTIGAQIADTVVPGPDDTVFVKKKPSAFFGTPLLSLLIDRHVDTLIVTGGSTANCVRATVVDSASYNLRTLVPHDCVFDRFPICHRIALFDIDRQYGDVVDSDTIMDYLNSLNTSRTADRNGLGASRE